MEKLPFNIIKKLEERREKGNFRRLPSYYSGYDFLSNDYLGLSRSQELYDEISKRYDDLSDKFTGATGSRLLSGNHSINEQVEEKLAKIFKAPSVLLFNSGYNANLAILSAIPQKRDTIIYDEYVHVCLKEGARLSFAKRFSFRHNDMNDLESKLKIAEGNIYVVVESVYSMDGDQVPLEEVINLSKKYDAFLIIDEAHSTGIIGSGGNGLVCSKGLEEQIFARVYTFGKGMGVHGACIAGSSILKDYLVNFATPFIYTTALPLHSIISIDTSFDYLQNNLHLQKYLEEKINFFKEKLTEYQLPRKYEYVESKSAIQVFIVPGNDEVKKLSGHLNQKGYNVKPILSPTVKEGRERLRFCLHTYNTDEEITGLIKEIAAYIS
jgi:8-amino-7-oxononanoate synthase